jgi:pimeloyl-ACP methyl ester carboxylesterase
VILCGHSYGGFVIGGVADQIPDQIRALLYLDAFVPEDGECVLDLRSHEQVLEMRQQIQTTGDGWKVAPIPAEVFNVNSRDCAWVNTQCTPQSLACFEEPIRLRGGLARIQDVTHILATGWGGLPLPAFHERAKMRGWRTRTSACGHDVMLDLPNELTDLLLEYASS